MGWGIEFKTNIFLNKMSIQNIFDLYDIIKEKESELEAMKTAIYMYASSDPKLLISDEWKDDPIIFIQLKIKEILTEIEELITVLTNLYHYKEYLEDNGKSDEV